MSEPVLVTHVYAARGVVSGWVTTEQGTVHHIGHTAWHGWFCTCDRGKRCAQINKVKELVPVEAVELGAANVRAGIAPSGVCAVRPNEIKEEV